MSQLRVSGDPLGLRAPGDPLEPADHGRLFRVLEDVVDTVGQEHFFDELQLGLARHLGWTDGVIVDIPAVVAPFPAPPVAMKHFHSNRPREFLEQYVERFSQRRAVFKSWRALGHMDQHGVVTLSDMRGWATAAEWEFVETFLHPHGIGDVSVTFVDAGPPGVALLVLYSAEEGELGGRELALQQRLRRHLAPLLHVHFTGAQSDGSGWSLTARESDVANLVARGLTNRQIAERLSVTVDTVKKHLTHALTKTGCASRTQLAALWRS